MINKEKVVDYVVATKCIFERNWKLGKYRDILKHGDSYEYHSLLEHFTRLQRLNKKKQSNKKQKKTGNVNPGKKWNYPVFMITTNKPILLQMLNGT